MLPGRRRRELLLMAGTLTSLAIIVVCFAGLHSIVDLRRAQARAAGVPYMDGARLAVLLSAGIVGVCYFGWVVIAAALG